MKLTPRLLILAAITLAIAAGSTIHAQKSFDERIDISQTLAAALRQFDTATVDAIVLSEGQSVTWLPDGRLSTVVHRIIWINSGVTIDEYGDIRVPYDQERCSFTPLAVRVWREGRWWPSDSSGVVETLPFALDHAYDYTGKREVMLLLNGLEPPCIAEIAYRIEDRTAYRKGVDGLWLFASDDPGMESWYELALPPDINLHVSASTGIGSPKHRTDPATGLKVSRWRVGPHPARPRPYTSDPAVDIPHLSWSTWKSWSDLGAFVTAGFQPTAVLDRDLAAAVDSLVRTARTESERARLIADFIGDHVSLVDYSLADWWFSPRNANRTYATAYGHNLDRSVLAASLFSRAGLSVRPMLIGRNSSTFEPDIPSLTLAGTIAVSIENAGNNLLYRPGTPEIVDILTATDGCVVWSPGIDSAPSRIPGREGALNVRLDLTYDRAKGAFTGTGLLIAKGGLSPATQVTGLNSELKSYLSSLTADLIKGATLTACNLERLDPSEVIAGFSLEFPRRSGDSTRAAMTIGKLRGGIIDHLPADVQLFREQRLSTVGLPCPMTQRVEISLDAPPGSVIYTPPTLTIENEAGRFSVTSENTNGRLTVTRELRLTNPTFAPAIWPALRRLLLAENNEGNGTVILKAATGDRTKK